MKIIQVTQEWNLPASGNAVVVNEISKELARRGHEVTVLTGIRKPVSADSIASSHFNDTSRREKENDEPESQEGFEVHRYRTDLGFNDYWISSQLVKKLLTEPADVFHTHGIRLFHSDATALASVTRRIPFVITPHLVYPPIYPRNKPMLAAYDAVAGSIVFRLASRCQAITRYHADTFRRLGVPEDRIRVIPNGINPERYFVLPDPSLVRRKYELDGELVTFIGRLNDVKSPPLVHLMEAIKRLQPEYPRLRLAVIGPDWGYLPRLRTVAKDLGIQDSVLFTGKVTEEEKMTFLSASDIGAVVSENEAFPITMLEFMAAGKPVIASRVGAIPWVLKDGSAGLLCDNNPESMTRILGRILSDKKLAKRMGEEGRRLTQTTYTWSNVVDQLEDTYMECQTTAETNPKPA